MVIDHLENAYLYEEMHSNFKKAFAFLRREDLASLAPGRYEIDGGNIYALIMEYDTKRWKDGKWETHRNYIDILLMCEGEEQMGYAPTGRLSSVAPYNSEKDIEFHTGEGSMITLSKNDFMIFFPEEGHLPYIAMDEKSTRVKKAVIKVRI